VILCDGEHAACLAGRAQSAEVSQGAYVMGLLEERPPGPSPVDLAGAVAALAVSAHKVAAMSADIYGLIRLMRNVRFDEAEQYRATLMSLAIDMRAHPKGRVAVMTGPTSQQRTSRFGVAARGC